MPATDAFEKYSRVEHGECKPQGSEHGECKPQGMVATGIDLSALTAQRNGLALCAGAQATARDRVYESGKCLHVLFCMSANSLYKIAKPKA
jgi:hypothetical protein